MDHRCPVCRADLGRRRLSQAIVARMEIDCSNCKSRLRLNIHRAETLVVMISFGILVALGLLIYWLRSEALALAALGAALVGSLALPLLERTWLRAWPRYSPVATGGTRVEGGGTSGE